MKKIYLLGLLFAGLLGSCSNEDIVNDSISYQKGNYTLSVSMGGLNSRAFVSSDKFDVCWEPGDKIGVYGATDNNAAFSLVPLGTGEFSSLGTFTGTLKGEPTYGYYPYSENGSGTVVLPEMYEITDGYFANHGIGPMVGQIDTKTKTLQFKHLSGIVKVRIDNVPTSAVKFTLKAYGEDGTSAKNIAGTASIASPTTAEAALTLANEGGKNEVSVTFNVSKENSQKYRTFYIPIPTGTYGKLEATLYDASSNVLYTRATGEVVIDKGMALNMSALDASVWDGKTKKEPSKQDDVYQITSAAELAWFQGDANHASTVAELPATMTANAKLLTNIDLGNYPWVGMVLGENIEFDGGGYTISNVTVNEPSLLQSEKNHYACAGLFGATKANSKIKNITVDKVTIAPSSGNKNIKWVGGLLGYSYGSVEFTNCHATNVTISVDGHASIRVGGLIGYIEKYHGTLEPSVILTNCSASHVDITANYSYGGLIGSFWDSVKLEGCTTSDVTLNLGTSTAYYGYVSKFIGDVANTTGPDRKIIINNCSVDAWKDGEIEALKLTALKDAAENPYKVTSPYVGIVDAPQVMNIIVDGKELISGIDFNCYEGATTWNGTSKVKPVVKNDIYLITTAAELAWFQSQTAPNDKNKESLDVTVDKDAVLCADIDLANKPWLGMVINEHKFDGGGHTISNLNMSQYLLNQQETKFTPEACIGLFAAVYGSSEIKDTTLDGVTIEPASEKSPKWVGSLVGFSKGTGTTYTNCIAKDVKILTKGNNSYRVGGLIGYIEKSQGTDQATATLTGCKVETANIASSFSYGGLVGSLYDSVTFTDCHTSNITLALNGDCTDNLGYVSKFIGDVTNAKTHNRVIVINSCSADLLSSEEQNTLNFSSVAGQQKKTGTYTPVSPFVGIVDVTDQMTIKVDGNTLVNGTDYNKYVE